MGFHRRERGSAKTHTQRHAITIKKLEKMHKYRNESSDYVNVAGGVCDLTEKNGDTHPIPQIFEKNALKKHT